MRRVAVAALVIAAGLAGAGALWTRSYVATPLAVPEGGYRLEIAPGTSWAGVTRRLADDGITGHAAVLRAYGRITGQSNRIKAGEYQLMPGMTPASLLRELVAGRVVLHKLTLIEGWSVRDTLRAIQAEPALAKTLRTAASRDRAVDPARDLARELGLPWPSAEGAFLPETYLFALGTTDRDILSRAHAALKDELDRAWSARSPNLPLASPYELLILASIVERETALASERPRIAGVFVRRLQQGMRLQTDPTVIYGLGAKFDGNLRRRDLLTDGRYNTYTRSGLPPTPIAMAGEASIRAALNPAKSPALYFVSRGDGTHQFSSSLVEHNVAVNKYQKLRR